MHAKGQKAEHHTTFKENSAQQKPLQALEISSKRQADCMKRKAGLRFVRRKFLNIAEGAEEVTLVEKDWGQQLPRRCQPTIHKGEEDISGTYLVSGSGCNSILLPQSKDTMFHGLKILSLIHTITFLAKGQGKVRRRDTSTATLKGCPSAALVSPGSCLDA